MHEADPYASNPAAANHVGAHHDAAHAAHDADPHDHPAPFGALVAVFVALLFLTVITVAVRYVDLGEFNLLMAMAIAVVKGSLVVAIFMHLWWDSRFNTISLIAAFAFVALFIGITILDSYQYGPTLKAYRTLHPLEERHLPQGSPEATIPSTEASPPAAP